MATCYRLVQSLSNIIIYERVVINAENGSGGWISRILVDGGPYGFLGRNQRYSVHDFSVQNGKHGIGLIWDWAWVSELGVPLSLKYWLIRTSRDIALPTGFDT